jgi:hypothetical protein
MVIMAKRYLDGDVKIQKNLLHEYHKVIDSQTGKIDQTDWKVCKCKYCFSWTPEVLKAYDDFLNEEKQQNVSD